MTNVKIAYSKMGYLTQAAYSLLAIKALHLSLHIYVTVVYKNSLSKNFNKRV